MGDFFDWFMDFTYDLTVKALSPLPDSPLQSDEWDSGLNAFEGIMGQINYFVPIGNLFLIMTSYLSAVMVWYGVRWALRFSKFIS